MPILVLLFSVLFSFSVQAQQPVPEEIQSRIIQLYEQGNCKEMREFMQVADLSMLRPNVMAIAAFCEPYGWIPEGLFERAEELSPTGDLILVLHAKYLSLKDPKSADPIWEKVLMTARNVYFRELAKERLAGVIGDPKKERAMDLSPSTLIGNIYFAGFYTRNPELQELAFENPKHSYGIALGGLASYRHWYEFGSLGVRYFMDYKNYGRASDYDYLNNNLEVPLAFHLVTSKDLIFRPFFGYSSLGGNPYHFIYGLGMKAAVYTGSHVQSVQGIFYNDRIYHSLLTPAQGSHYRFEFAWDFYPLYWTVSTLFAVEHVSGTPVSEFLGSQGNFEMSHNDLSMEFKFDRAFKRFELELEPKFKYRLDTSDSTYASKEGPIVNRQREDFEASIKSTISIPLAPSIKFFAWYEWDNVYSSVNFDDYANFNYHNHTFGLGLNATLTSY